MKTLYLYTENCQHGEGVNMIMLLNKLEVVFYRSGTRQLTFLKASRLGLSYCNNLCLVN